MTSPFPVAFLGGSPSSGTTLLARLLDGVHRIRSAPELGLVHHTALFEARDVRAGLMGLLQRGGTPLFVDVDGLAVPLIPTGGFLERDLYGIATPAHGMQWMAEIRDLPSVLVSVRDRLAARHGWPADRLLLDQTPVNAAAAVAILSHLPDARFVHLLRDGRDVIASLATRWGAERPGHARRTYVRAAALSWAWSVRRARRAAHLPGYLEIRYADLVTAPLDTLSAVTRHLGQPAVTPADRDRAAAVEPVGGPERFQGGRKSTWSAQPGAALSTRSLGRWRRDLDPEHLAAVLSWQVDVPGEPPLDVGEWLRATAPAFEVGYPAAEAVTA